MLLKYFSILITIFNFHCVLSQNASCEYSTVEVYQCVLTLDNREKFNNFTSIDGNHAINITNSDVEKVKGIKDVQTFSSIYPSIICDQFRNLKIIELIDYKIEKIDKNALENCKNLQMLNFNENRIEKLSKNAFVRQSKLIELRLAENHLDELAQGIFDSLDNLEVLDLSKNKFKMFNSNLFMKTRKLRELNLNGNLISRLAENQFSSLNNLEKLMLSDNNLSKLNSSSFGNHSMLQTFEFARNQITAIDEQIFIKIVNKTSLKIVNASDNRCIETSEHFRNETINRITVVLRKCFREFNKKPKSTTTRRRSSSYGSRSKIGKSKVPLGTSLKSLFGNSSAERLTQLSLQHLLPIFVTFVLFNL